MHNFKKGDLVKTDYGNVLTAAIQVRYVPHFNTFKVYKPHIWTIVPNNSILIYIEKDNSNFFLCYFHKVGYFLKFRNSLSKLFLDNINKP